MNLVLAAVAGAVVGGVLVLFYIMWLFRNGIW